MSESGEVTEPFLETGSGEIDGEDTTNAPIVKDTATDADVIFLELIKKKNEERTKGLRSIYMSYEKLLCDDTLIQNGGVHSESSTEDILGSKGSKSQKLNEAVMSLDYVAVSRLLEQGAGVDIPNRFGRCPLHNAILKNDYKMVKLILQAFADVSLKDDRGDTPLHYAVRTGNELIIKDLLNYSECDVNAEGSNGATPLHVAASLNKYKLCKLLLDHMARLDNKDTFGKTPLGKAMESGASKAAKYLLEFISQNNIDLKLYLCNADKEGSTLLHLAVDSGVLKVVKLCLKYGAVIRQPKEKDRSTAFHLACEQGSVEIVRLLLENDPGIARIFLIDTNGATPLHNAAKNNSHALMELLLEHGANVNAKDGNNVTPLMLAARFGATDTVQLLLEKGADPTIKNIDGRTVVFNAVGHGNCMKVLLANKNLIALLTENDSTGFAPPHYAAKQGDVKSMQLFLENNKATAAVTSDSLDTPLHVAARHGKHEIISLLLEKQASKIINLQDTRGRTALHYAASGGHHRAAAKLLSYGATIERDQNDRTPLHEAARKGSMKTVELIVNGRMQCLNEKDDECNTALHLAAIYQQPQLVSFLLDQSTQEIFLNSSNQTVLNIALEMNNHDVTEAILEHERWREVLMACNTNVSKQMMIIIEKMPHLAERLLDHCTQKEGNPFARDYKIKYDLSLILVKQASGKGNSLKILQCMVEHRRDRCLTHPLCFIVLSTKWKKFGCYIFLLNLLLFLTLLIPQTYLHIMLEDNDNIFCSARINHNTEDGTPKWDLNDRTCFMKSPMVQAIQYLIIISAVIQVIKEVVQFYYQRMRYIASVSSWLDIVGTAATLVSVVPPCECKWGFQKEAAAFAIFISWINLIMYFRRLPFYGKYVIMLYCMFKTLLKVLVLFMFFIIAFGATFHIIMDKEPFTTLPNILMNMFIMTLGEMNYTDVFMPWSELFYPSIVNVLMVLFCLSMPIIMMNMLVGLAVGDIGKIEQNALIDRYIMQVELLIDLENALPSCILRRFQLDHVIDYPNRKPSALAKIYDALVGFGTGNDEDNENDDDMNMPELAKLNERLDDQAAEIDEIHKTVTTILELLRAQEDHLKTMKTATEDKKKLIPKQVGLPPMDFLGSFTSTAFSFGNKKNGEAPNQDL